VQKAARERGRPQPSRASKGPPGFLARPPNAPSLMLFSIFLCALNQASLAPLQTLGTLIRAV
jgi:hypothetical protein